MSPKKRPTKQAGPNGKNPLWHWHHKHPVEFSKNNHTPTTTPTQGHSRGNSPTLPGPVRGVKPGLPGLSPLVRSRQQRATRSTRCLLGRIWQAVLGGARAPHLSGSLPAVQHYPTSGPVPNRFDSSAGTVTPPDSSRGLRVAQPAWSAPSALTLIFSARGREKATPRRS